MRIKHPPITWRSAMYAQKLLSLNQSDSQRLELLSEMICAAFRKGYQTRKADERKERKSKVGA